MRQIYKSDITNDYKFYLYRHIDIDNNIPVYVGIGTRKSIYNTTNHSYKRALSMSEKSRSKDYYEYSLKNRIRYEIIFQTENLEEVKSKEVEFIELYGRRDLGTGTLFNLTKGGDSLSESVMYATNHIIKTCETCNTEFKCIKSRELKCKYCSRECSAKAVTKNNNCNCSQCGEPIKRKPSELDKSKNVFCSSRCLGNFKSQDNIGNKNPNFGNIGPNSKIFKGEIIIKNHNGIPTQFIYNPNHPHKDENNRILLSKNIVENNYEKFDKDFFIEIDNFSYLKKTVVVYHKDNNKLNCSINNLELGYKDNHFLRVIHNRDFGKKRGVKFKYGKYYVTLAKEVIGKLDNEQDAYELFKNKFFERYGYNPW